jgi:hypothetical protein
LAVYSIDSDTLFYLYAGLIIDRLVCLPRNSRRNYAIKWSGVLLLSGLTGLLLYLQLYEWLIYSSRAIKSYAGILNPGFINMATAVLTDQWLKDWPYDPSYFYFGPAAIWFILAGLAKIDKTSYMFRYFLYSLVIPVFYLITRSLQSHYHLSIFNSLDIWRSMFVFCLGLAMVAAVGVRDILQGQRFQQRLTLSVGLATAVLAILSIVYGMYLETRVILSIAAAAILTTVFIKIKRSKFIQGTGVSIAIIAAVVIPVINRTVSSPSCAWNSTVLNLTVQPPYIQCNAFMRNLGFYRALARAIDGQNCHWRVSLFGGIDNMTSLAGLKTLPNYTFIYNKGVEENLYLDGLISKGENLPYWMKLEAAKSSTLGIYGVRFLVSLGNRELAESDNGWLERKDLSWPDHRVWENLNYIGRAYLVSPSGQRRSGVEFLEDKSTSISLRITAEQGDRLVLADLYYPGWQAFVDDEPVATDVYHGCLRSVNLPVGEHTVSWKYNSRTKQTGLFLSALVLLLLISFLVMLHVSRKRNEVVTKNNF